MCEEHESQVFDCGFGGPWGGGNKVLLRMLVIGGRVFEGRPSFMFAPRPQLPICGICKFGRRATLLVPAGEPAAFVSLALGCLRRGAACLVAVVVVGGCCPVLASVLRLTRVRARPLQPIVAQPFAQCSRISGLADALRKEGNGRFAKPESNSIIPAKGTIVVRRRSGNVPGADRNMTLPG